MRRPVKKKTHISPDSLYNSLKVEQFINYVMLDGRKNAARKVVYGAFEEIKKQLETDDPVEIFETALKNVGPSVEVRSRRVGGANYQVPREVRPERRTSLAMRWILQATKSRSGGPMAKFLAEELIAASKNEGAAVKKREDTHKMAESNRAFAHFAW
ncbi:MAG: 30S ribosomal protein S7 [Candidatus Paceibacterota bacterium]